jgi:hypothetical protein
MQVIFAFKKLIFADVGGLTYNFKLKKTGALNKNLTYMYSFSSSKFKSVFMFDASL